ncbi:hypothetical protein PV328_008847 [Microctonus aethiopoides]|uniref:Promethin n=1 Tax=Microctonus aethiopoides TaxID=144406 RepID=A0AA39KRE9_9HYME|nr:hypothetical protein PV328_008847 [Microctonus aethiopoides]
MTETKNTSSSVKPDSSKNSIKNDIITTIKKKYTRIKHNVNKFMIDNKLYENVDQVIKYLKSHPILLTIFISILAILLFPILLFIIFVVINVAFAFSGFIVVLVSVLSIGATVFCSLLFAVIMAIIMIGICLVFTWTLSCYMLSLMRNFNIIRPRN